MVQIGGEIEGFKQLAANAGKLRKSFLTSTLRTALRNAAAPVRKFARDQAPVDEGNLKGAIESRAEVPGPGSGYADVGVAKGNVFYGHFIELGTSQRSARPFLRPALEKGHRSGEVNKRFILALNKTIASIRGG